MCYMSLIPNVMSCSHRVRQFINSLPGGALVADVGCGNGKYFGVRADIAVLGSDRSLGLAQVPPVVGGLEL